MKILIADDHELVREGLRNILNVLLSAPVIHDARNAQEVVTELSNERDFSLIILDLMMPGVVGLELLAHARNSADAIPIVVISAHLDPALMKAVMNCGAAGYVPKNTPREIMQMAIKLVLSGGTYFPQAVLQDFSTGTPYIKASVGHAALARHTRDLRSSLTERQKQVLKLLGHGKQNKQIARELGLSEHTVKVHVAAILGALGVTNRTQAVIRARDISVEGAQPTK